MAPRLAGDPSAWPFPEEWAFQGGEAASRLPQDCTVQLSLLTEWLTQLIQTIFEVQASSKEESTSL